MHKFFRYALQLFVYAALATAIGYFSVSPRYQYASAEAAIVKVSLSHATNRIAPCVLLTPSEVAELAPNMRRAEKCERARLPLTIEVDVDGKLKLSERALPSGLWSDGPASIYRRFDMPPGQYRLNVRLRDTNRAEGWDYDYNQDVRLEAGRYLTITFRAENGGFEFR
jgi:hypothetical protein